MYCNKCRSSCAVFVRPARKCITRIFLTKNKLKCFFFFFCLGKMQKKINIYIYTKNLEPCDLQKSHVTHRSQLRCFPVPMRVGFLFCREKNTVFFIFHLTARNNNHEITFDKRLRIYFFIHQCAPSSKTYTQM